MKRRTFLSKGTELLLASVLLPPLLIRANAKPQPTVPQPRFKTSLCSLLNIEYPILQAGMSSVAGPQLVAAVSNAGGLGILPATMVTPEEVRKNIREVRRLTDRPFGVNLLLQRDMYPPADFTLADFTVQAVQGTLNKFRSALQLTPSYTTPPKLPPLIAAAFEVILEEKVPVWSVGLGNPTVEMVERCHRQGMRVIAMVAMVADALTVVQAGVDGIVAQGSEAGGHRSTWEKKDSGEYARIGTLALVQAIRSNVKVPVIAAGGIADGAGMLAALSLGAQGVLIGTRFAATVESIGPACYKQQLIAGSSDQTVVTDVFTGMYARVIRNAFTEEYRQSGAPVLPPGRQFMATSDIVKKAGESQNSAYYPLYAGQGLDQIREIFPAAVVMERLIAETLLARRALNTTVQL